LWIALSWIFDGEGGAASIIIVVVFTYGQPGRRRIRRRFASDNLDGGKL